ncbi:MAG: cytidine/deoxycytidylate deaminase family protein [Candidatus Pacebacteria bacterium]|nr:cytidine/deoxycytidylate deaminase family protein [Candidatus Paceibacterota bacterium]
MNSEAPTRPSWDEYFLQMAELVGTRGTCDRGHAGIVIVKDKRLLATGYAGSPIGLPHCDEVGHEMTTVTNEEGVTSRHCIRTTHSETNAIANAARFGVAVDGATMYSTMVACYACAKVVINAGIKRFVARKDYHASGRTKDIFKEAGVELVILTNEVTQYKDQ